MTLVLLLGVINVPAKVGRRAWRRCFGLMLRASDIFGVNEVFDRDQKRLYLRLARRKGLGQYGTRIGPNPVFWDREKYRKVWAAQTKLHPAGTGWRARRWPGYNAARYVTEVVLQPVAGGPELAVLNTHWVPRGRKVPARWRESMRAISRAKVAAMIEAHQAAGRVVIPLGDTNIAEPFRLPGVTWLRATGVDKIGIALPVRWRLGTARQRRIKAPTDHGHGIAVAVEIHGRKETR